VVQEDDTASRLWTELPLVNAYAAGYGASKWAGELLLEDAHRRFAIPVTTFRCGMILAHSQELGQINAADFFTRLLCGLIYTGVAPASFYNQNYASEAKHFDGAPVDYVATTIAQLTLRPTADYAIYHCVNDHWHDGISLDSIVAWVGSAGYQIRIISDYQEWFQIFRTRLQLLSPQQKQRSPLPILYQWEQPIDVMRETKFSAAKLRGRLAELGLSSATPQLSEPFIHHCLADLRYLGVIPA
jgi:fatty acid CoA ligase FadD9